MLNFSNKNILLGVTGGIAAYKSAEIIRLFKKEGADVRVVMTKSSKEFITPLTLQAVSGNEIHDSLLDVNAESGMGHIELAKWADIVLIAPCTAETIAKITHGRADDLMGALILASNADIYIAPAMNMNMWLDKSTQDNYKTLESRGIIFIGPAQGEQACGDVGPGRMEEPNTILEFINLKTNVGLLSGKTITITAGPTREQIDPVRFISNNSPRRVARISSGRSSPVNGQPPSSNNNTTTNTIVVRSNSGNDSGRYPRSANSSPVSSRYVRNNISRSNSSNNSMNDLAEALYDNNNNDLRNGNASYNYTDRDYFHKFSESYQLFQ